MYQRREEKRKYQKREKSKLVSEAIYTHMHMCTHIQFMGKIREAEGVGIDASMWIDVVMSIKIQISFFIAIIFSIIREQEYQLT